MKSRGLIAVAAVILFVMAVSVPIRLDDFFLYLALGRRLFEGGLPEVDPFLFTIRDHHWQPWHEWLSYVYYYGLFALGGYPAVLGARAVMALGAAALIAQRAWDKGVLAAVAVSASTLAAAHARVFHDRSSNFSDLFCLVLLSIFLSRQPARWRWYLPPLFALWVNLHSGFIFGWFILGLFILFNHRDWRLWWAPALGCGLAPLINPMGLEGVTWPVRAIFGQDWGILGRIVEFEPTYATASFTPIFKVYFGLFTLTALLLAARARDGFAMACTIVLAALGWRYARATGMAGLGLGIVIAALLPRLKPEREDGWAGAVLVLASLCGGLLPRGGWPLHETVPTAAVAFLKTLPPGPVFNEWQLGGFLAWELDGRQKIAAHGFVSDPQLAERNIYRATLTREGWDEIVLNGGVEYFFLTRQSFESMRDAVWVRELQGPGWRNIFADRAAVIFQKKYRVLF